MYTLYVYIYLFIYAYIIYIRFVGVCIYRHAFSMNSSLRAEVSSASVWRRKHLSKRDGYLCIRWSMNWCTSIAIGHRKHEAIDLSFFNIIDSSSSASSLESAGCICWCPHVCLSTHFCLSKPSTLSAYLHVWLLFLAVLPGCVFVWMCHSIYMSACLSVISVLR